MNFDPRQVFLKVKDFTVSNETFDLVKNENYDILKTLPQPSLENLPSYYQSADYISHTDSKRSLFEKLYHLVKLKNLSDKVRLITKLQRGIGHVLDLGAGTGDFLKTAASVKWEITGVEPIEAARNLAAQKNITLLSDTKNLESAQFDIITMWHVLEHVPNPVEQITELKRLLKPGGFIVVAVPNFKSFDADYYQNFWAAYDVPRHLWHFSKNAIEKLFGDQQLILQEVKPMYFDAFYVSLLSEKYKTGKMNFIKGFWIGLKSNIKGMVSNEYSSQIYIIKK